MSESNFDERMRRVETLVDELERRGGEPADASRALLRAVLDMHESALSRALAVAAAQGEAGRVVLSALAADPQVASLLLLHGLHPAPVETRIRQAVAALAADLASEGASLELVEVGADAVRLRLIRDASLSGAAARVEAAITDIAPDAPPIQVEDILASQLVPADRLVHRAPGGSP